VVFKKFNFWKFDVYLHAEYSEHFATALLPPPAPVLEPPLRLTDKQYRCWQQAMASAAIFDDIV